MPLSKITSNSISTAETFQSFSTGGVERMRIAANGNIGIGTNLPGLSATANRKYLTLKGSGTSSGDGCGILQFTSNTPHSIVTTLGNIEWNVFDNSGSSSTRVAYITASASGSAANNVGSYLAFATKSDGISGGGTERMRIDANGNIGLGVVPSSWSISSGITAFQIKGASLYSSTRELGTLSNAYYNAGWNYIDSAAASQYLQSSGEHYWYTASSGTAGNTITFNERMRISSAGDVGIGTSSPSVKLDLLSSQSSGAVIRLRNTNASGYTGAWLLDESGNLAAHLGYGGSTTGLSNRMYVGTIAAQPLVLTTSDIESMRIDATGNVSIGTTTTAVKFNVYSATNPLVANFDTGSASGSYIRFQNSGTSIGDLGSGVNLFGGGGYALDFGLTSRTGGNLVFGTASTERMRINSGGNIGIGVVPSISARRLTVYGSSSSAAVSSLVIQTSTSGTTASDGFSMELDGTTAYLWNYENAPLLFGTNASERARITAGGNFLFGTTSDSSFRMRVVDGNNVAYFGLLSTGRSGSEYPSIAHNVEYTTTPASYKYIGTDTAAMVRFNSGKVETLTASSGSSGAAISFTTGPYVAVGGTTWTAGSSDIRQKKNFESSQGLTALLQVEPVKFHFNWEEDSAPKRLGFKAQNLKTLIPEMVIEKEELAEDGTPLLTITPDYILPVLVKAIQELKAEFDEYKATHP